MKQPKRVEIEWVDPCMIRGWNERSHLVHQQPSHNRSTGYLLHRGENVVLALSLEDGATTAGDALIIPRANVKRIRRLR